MFNTSFKFVFLPSAFLTFAHLIDIFSVTLGLFSICLFICLFFPHFSYHFALSNGLFSLSWIFTVQYKFSGLSSAIWSILHIIDMLTVIYLLFLTCFRNGFRNNFSTRRLVQQWKRLTEEVLDFSSLEVFDAQLEQIQEWPDLMLAIVLLSVGRLGLVIWWGLFQ